MRALLPTTALVRRELLTNLRRVRSFVCLVLVVGFVTLLVVAVWPRDVNFARAGMATEYLLIAVSMSLLGACALFIPGLTGTAITVEKDRETFDLLDMTLIPRSSIVLAKLLNAVGFFLLLVIAVLPVLGSVLFLVGVDWVQIAASFAVIFVTVFSCAMAGLFCSTLVRRTALALALSYVGMIILMGGVLLPPVIIAGSLRWDGLMRLIEREALFLSP
ncbi:MAG TPA: ABC transporter permease, partial [Candidatus Hydrogenedentes bacterium]|nr:ABC transporter permease [Candidatus Hydrogenedentota bacterium]